MGLRIRLKRAGRRNRPYYKVVVADIKSPRDGKFIEEIGTYDPISEPFELKIKKERFLYWSKKGALPTHSVSKLLKIYNKRGGE